MRSLGWKRGARLAGLLGAALLVGVSGATRVDARPSDAGGPRLAAGAGRLTGTSQFTIGGLVQHPDGALGRAHFPMSRLEFPIDVPCGVVQADHVFDARWSMAASLTKELHGDAGKTRDSDWGYWHLRGLPEFGPDSLDVYSESDTELDALAVDLHTRYAFWRGGRFVLGLGLGYLFQRLDFTLSNLRQHYPSAGDGSAPDLAAGVVGEYAVRYSLPYLLASGTLDLGRTAWLDGGIGYSPRARAEDKGHWHLRAHTFDSTVTGRALLYRARLTVTLTESLLGILAAEGLLAELSGPSTSRDLGEKVGTIYQQTELAQFRTTVALGWQF